MNQPDSKDITQAVPALPDFPEVRNGTVTGARGGAGARGWSRALLRFLGILAGAALIGLAGYLIFRDDRPRAVEPVPLAAAKEIPPALHSYYARAMEGDPAAMRMLGTAYYNGLYITQNREEGILWYRKAAKAGSVAAKKDLEQLGIKE